MNPLNKAKQTGLGGSLLLRRTEREAEPPERPDAADAWDVSTSEPPETQEASATLERSERPTGSEHSNASSARRQKPQVLRDRCTLYLEREVNEQLDLTARIEGRQRSQVVSDLLKQHLPRYRIEPEQGSD